MPTQQSSGKCKADCDVIGSIKYLFVKILALKILDAFIKINHQKRQSSVQTQKKSLFYKFCLKAYSFKISQNGHLLHA